MSTLQASMSPSASNSNFDELRWVINIRRCLDEELEEEIEIPVCIFNVPQTLMSTKPESYVPQLVALGPYHYWRPELHEVEIYKVAAAKRTQKHLRCLNFHTVVDQLAKLEPRIRACYHKYMDFNGETLAWMMAIDASFLLEFLQIYALKEGQTTLSRVISSRMSHLIDHSGRKSAHNSILRDIVMLENQIPLFILRKVLEVQYSSLEIADDMLLSMLKGLCQELSPFKMIEKLPKIDISKCSHVLDFLYDIIVPKVDEPCETSEAEDHKEAQEDNQSDSADPSYVKQLLSEVCNLISKIKRGPLRLIKALLLSRPLRLVFKLPWKILSNLPGFSILKQPIEYLFFSQYTEEEKPQKFSGLNMPPLAEEIAIPSVVELSKSGVRFLATNANISTITFDVNTVTLYLPTVSLDINTEVVLRNLVAYEASNASGPLVFARYTELMNGIIDTEEDVKLLREKGIILNHLKSDKEAADLWNGMNKSIRLTKVPFLDKVIEDVNKYHNCRWNVKAGNFIKQYVYGSWQFLAFLAAITLLILMTFQAFCSVYNCSRTLGIQTSK